MNAQLSHLLARHRTAELRHAGERTRLAPKERISGRRLRHPNLITCLRARPARLLGQLIVPVMLAVVALCAPAATADPVGQITEFSAGLASRSDPGSIAAGSDGSLWFTDDGATPAIGRITPSGQTTEFSTGLNPGSAPFGIAAGPDGDIWFADDGATPAIGRITPSGQITEYSYGHGLNAGSIPIGIALGADGNLWFTDQGTNAIGRITPSGQITEFSSAQYPNLYPAGIAAGPDGNLWFTDQDAAIGRITPSGQITEFSTGLEPGALPVGIAAGPDGDLWFADANGAIGRIGSGAAPALAAPASVSGTGREGSPVTCEAPWSSWAGYAPSDRLYPFDGYAWLRDGTPVAGQTASIYVPTAGDVGHRLACQQTVTYPLPLSVTATATSAAIAVQSARPAPPPPPTPALSALHITPRMFTLTGRRVGGRCQPSSRFNRGKRSCIRRVALTVRFTLSVDATVTFAIEQVLPGQLTRGRCTAPTRSDRGHRSCTRQVKLRGTTVLNGRAGADAFTLTGKVDERALVPGRYRLSATPTADGIPGQQQQTTFEITR